MNNNMKEEIQKFIVDTLLHNKSELSDNHSLFDDGLIDSFGLIQLITFLENKFDVSIDMSDISIENFDTINQIVKFIKK